MKRLRGDVDLVILLIQYGADKSLQNDEGITPLDLAQKAGHESVVVVLR
jgi:ankyrin repeat protein